MDIPIQIVKSGNISHEYIMRILIPFEDFQKC